MTVTPLMQRYLLDHDLLTGRVHHAEATELLGLIPDNSIDLIVTSPPYDDLRKYNGYSFPFERIAHESYRVLKEGGVLVWVVGDSVVNGSETLTSFRQALYFKDAAGFNIHDTMIWNKYLPGVYGKRYVHAFEYMFVCSKGVPKTFNPLKQKNKNAGSVLPRAQRNGYQTQNGYQLQGKQHTVHEYGVLENVWRVATESGFEKHPAAYPEDLAEAHILTWSNPGDIVLDYFGGSGTTAKMARINLRRWITGDISGEYCDLQRKRLAQPFTLPMFAAIEANS